MEELIKPIIKVGNSAGILLPRKWLNGEAKVKLMEKPINIKQDILDILSDYLPSVISISIIGSHARNEAKKHSDVDVLVITSNLNKNIKKGKYEITLIAKESLESQLKKNIIPILPMLKEAKPILNEELLEKYKKTGLTKENLKWHFEMTRSALKISREFIKLNKELEKEYIEDAVVYSLILRLRELYFVKCLIKNTKYANKDFIKLVKKITGSDSMYFEYLNVKENKKTFKKISIEQAEKVYNFILSELKKQEKL